MIITISLAFPITIQITSIQYSITDYSHHAIHYNPMAYFRTESLCFGPLHPPTPLPLAVIILFSVL